MSTVSIVIKTYNEAQRIDAALASVWAARHEVPGHALDIVVADSLSEDGTAQAALRWTRWAPVRVVQLVHPQDRSCGAGVALGCAWVRGDWVLLMDGDMELLPGFLAAALGRLQEQPRLAGVGGRVEEAEIRNGSDRIRHNNALGRMTGPRPWLEGGGLYRRAALRSIGGFAADPRLAAFEEADLGLRLARQGWQLERLDVPAMRHHGHAAPTWRVLLSRWRSGRATAAGRLLRLHAGRVGGRAVLRLLAHPMALGIAWLALLVLTCWSPDLAMAYGWPAAATSFAGVSALQWWRKRDLEHVLTAWVDWHLMLAGLLVGLSRHMPAEPRVPACRLLREAGRP